MTIPSTNAPISPYNFVGSTVYCADGGNNALLSSTAILVGAGQHYITGVDIWNPNSADIWIQVFDAAATASVTVGTTKPNWSWHVFANGVWEEKFVDYGRLRINNGIVIAATTTATGSGAPSTGLQINLMYV